MDFKPDLFISYAHIDNQPINPDQDGWVSVFHKALEIRLSQLLGEHPQIWRDPKIIGNDYLNETIHKYVSSASLLISILSPRYLKSEWCMRELEIFCKEDEQFSDLRSSENKSRLFKVIKTYLPVEQHPSELQSVIGYDFFDLDEFGRPKEYDKVYSQELERKFYAKLNDLAYDIHLTLKLLDTQNKGERAKGDVLPVETKTVNKTIYLAETTHELSDVREKIRRELIMAGYQILPTNPLPFSPEFSHLARVNLAKCALSIHCINSIDPVQTVFPSSSAKALHQLLAARSKEQIEISEECYEGEKNFSRVLWMPPSSQIGENDVFLKNIQDDPDFVTTSLEGLKTVIQERVSELSSSFMDKPDDCEVRKIYLDCDQQDLVAQEIEPLYDWLEKHFQVVLPDYSVGSLTQSEASLKQCEAVLIYYGRASGLWLKRRLLALQKTLYNRPKPLLAKAVYVARSTTSAKQIVSGLNIPIINGPKEFDPEVLSSFLSALEKK